MKRTKKSSTRKGGAVSKKMTKGGAMKKIKPAIRKAVKKAIQVAVPLATSAVAPELVPLASALTNQYSDKAVNALGSKLGFGYRGGALRAGSDYSQFQAMRSPAMNPVLPLPDFSRPDFKHTGAKVGGMLSGGSFMPAGY